MQRSISLTYLHRDRNRGTGDVRNACVSTSLLRCPIAQWMLRNSMKARSVEVEVVHVGCSSFCAFSDRGGGSAGGRAGWDTRLVGVSFLRAALLVRILFGFGILIGGPCSNLDCSLRAAVIRSCPRIGESIGIDGAVRTLITRRLRTSFHVSRLVVTFDFVWEHAALFNVVVIGSTGWQRDCRCLNNLTRLFLAMFVTIELTLSTGKVANKSV